jgi:hypothetical protein
MSFANLSEDILVFMLSPMLDDNSNVNLFQMNKGMTSFIPKISIKEKMITILTDNCFHNKSFRKTNVRITAVSKLLNTMPNYVNRVYISNRRYLDNILPKNLHELIVENELEQPIITTSLPENLKVLRIHKVKQTYSQLIRLAPPNLEELHIMSNANSLIKKLPTNLKVLCINGYYTHPLCLPNTLKKLTILEGFNSTLEMPDGLEYFEINNHFDQLIVFPDSLKQLIFKGKSNHPITLPLKIEKLHITWGSLYSGDAPTISFTKYEHLRELVISGQYNNKPIELPDNLEVFESLSYFDYNHPIILPKKLKRLKISNKFNQLLDLPNTLEEFYLDCFKYNCSLQLPESLKIFYICATLTDPNIILPSNLKHLILIGNFNHPIVLPKYLEKLEIYNDFNHPIELPDLLKHLSLGGCFNKQIALPNSLESFRTTGNFNHPVIFPNSLKTIFIRGCFDQQINIPPNLIQIEIDGKFNAPLEFTTPKKIKLMSTGMSRIKMSFH